MKRLLLAAFAAAAIGIASPVLAQDTKDAKDAAAAWKLTKGDKTRYAYSYEFERAIEAMGMQIPQTTKLTMHLSQEVTEVAAGTATVSARIDRIIVDADMGPMGGGLMSFDSADAKAEKKEDKKSAKSDTPRIKGDDDEDDDKPAKKKKAKKKDESDDEDDEDAASPLAALQFAVGKSFTFKVAADGSVTDLDGLDEITMKVAQKGHVGEGLQMPRQGDMAGAQRMMKKMALPTVLVLFSKDVVQQTLDLHCHLFAAGGGETWKLDTTEQFPTMGNITFTRTIAPKGDGEAGGQKGMKLDQTSTEPKFKPMAMPGGMGGMGGGMGGMAAMLGKLKMKNASFKGWSIFSKEKGCLLGDELVQKATFEGSMPNPMAPKKSKKKAADDDDDEDGAAKKKKDDSKKDDSKKDDSKKDDAKADDDDEDEGSMKLIQKVTLRLKYEVLTGESAKKSDDKKSDDKKSDDKKSDDKKSDDKKKDKDF